MRLAFWIRRDAGDLPVYRPLLLDQAGVAALNRLAAERADADAAAERSPRLQQAGGPSRFARVKRIVLPIGMMAFGGLITFGMAFGAVHTATDADGVTRVDAFRITVMALLSLMFLGQLLTMLRMLPGAGWLTARLRFLRPPPPPPPPPLLLDQVTATALNRGAPQDLGAMSRAGLLRSRSRRLADLGSWVGLVLLAVGVALFFAAGSALGAWSALWHGDINIGALLRIVFLLFAAFGVVMLSMAGLRGVRQRRQRRRKRLLKRLLRFLLRLFDSGRRWAGDVAGVSGRGAARGYMRHPTSPLMRLSGLSPMQFGRALVLTAAVAGIAFYPVLFDNGGSAGATGGGAGDQLAGTDDPGSGGGGTSGGGSSQGEPATPLAPAPDSDEDVLGAQATGEADGDGDGSLTSPSNADGATAVPTPTFTPTNTPTATASPTATATFTPTPTPSNTPVPTETPRPTVEPTATRELPTPRPTRPPPKPTCPPGGPRC